MRMTKPVLSNDQPLELVQRLVENGYEIISQTPVLPKHSQNQAEDVWLVNDHVNFIKAHLGQDVIFWGYEWVSFHLPGGSYTPDFLYLLGSGQQVYVEIKGSRKQANYRDARSKLRGAATLNPWFWFYEARLARNAWEFERVPPDPAWLAHELGSNGGMKWNTRR